MGAVVLAVCVFFYLNQTMDKKNKQEEISSLVFETPDFFNDGLIDEEAMGKFYIINFFASWCKPCLAEHPLLMEMKKKGIKIYINLL